MQTVCFKQDERVYQQGKVRLKNLKPKKRIQYAIAGTA